MPNRGTVSVPAASDTVVLTQTNLLSFTAVAFLILELRYFALPQRHGQCPVSRAVLFVRDIRVGQRPKLFIGIPYQLLIGPIRLRKETIPVREGNANSRVFEDRMPSALRWPADPPPSVCAS